MLTLALLISLAVAPPPLGPREACSHRCSSPTTWVVTCGDTLALCLEDENGSRCNSPTGSWSEPNPCPQTSGKG